MDAELLQRERNTLFNQIFLNKIDEPKGLVISDSFVNWNILILI